eukprot:14534893-Alexandrium_andersonii.AAC.1
MTLGSSRTLGPQQRASFTRSRKRTASRKRSREHGAPRGHGSDSSSLAVRARDHRASSRGLEAKCLVASAREPQEVHVRAGARSGRACCEGLGC